MVNMNERVLPENYHLNMKGKENKGEIQKSYLTAHYVGVYITTVSDAIRIFSVFIFCCFSCINLLNQKCNITSQDLIQSVYY